jgi:hypothetical protein
LREAQNDSNSGVKFSSCQGTYRLDSYIVRFDSAGYSVIIECVASGQPNLQGTDETYLYPENVTARSFPSQNIKFYSVGRGTNLASTAYLELCAFGYGQRINIDPKGNISNTEITCS